MKRLLLIVAVAMCGCDEREPLPVAKVQGWAYTMAGVAILDNADAPDSPSPEPGGKCPNCNGTGKVGDGRVFTDCLECGGDGVLDSGEVALDDPGDPLPGGIPSTGPEPVVGMEPQGTIDAPVSTSVCGPSGCTTMPANRSRVYTPRRPGLLRRVFR